MDTHTNIHITETRIQTQTTLGEIKRLATLCVEAQAERTNTQPKNKLKQPLGMLATKAEAAQTQTHTTMTNTNNNIWIDTNSWHKHRQHKQALGKI